MVRPPITLSLYILSLYRHTHRHRQTQTQTDRQLYTHQHTDTHIHACMCVCVCVCVYTRRKYTHICTHVYIHIWHIGRKESRNDFGKRSIVIRVSRMYVVVRNSTPAVKMWRWLSIHKHLQNRDAWAHSDIRQSLDPFLQARSARWHLWTQLDGSYLYTVSNTATAVCCSCRALDSYNIPDRIRIISRLEHLLYCSQFVCSFSYTKPSVLHVMYSKRFTKALLHDHGLQTFRNTLNSDDWVENTLEGFLVWGGFLYEGFDCSTEASLDQPKR